MPLCAFLTLEDPTGYVIDDDLVYDPLRSLGWSVEAVPWSRAGMSWSRFDVVVIRSPWDYQNAPDSFLDVLAQIERSGTPLLNPLDLVRWNLRKTYLRELASSGIPIVPTLWRDRLGRGDLIRLFEEMNSADQIVVKPIVSANADGAFRLDRREAEERAGEIETYYADRPLMAQPFVGSVLDEGEYSLFYFNGAFSHAIVKTPEAGDFRVQEEHGGIIRPVDAGRSLREAGKRVMNALRRMGVADGRKVAPVYPGGSLLHPRPDGVSFAFMNGGINSGPLYARVDFVRADPEWPSRQAGFTSAKDGDIDSETNDSAKDGGIDSETNDGEDSANVPLDKHQDHSSTVASADETNAQNKDLHGEEYWLMELELIEPALYFRMDAGAPERFAAALAAQMKTLE